MLREKILIINHIENGADSWQGKINIGFAEKGSHLNTGMAYKRKDKEWAAAAEDMGRI